MTTIPGEDAPVEYDLPDLTGEDDGYLAALADAIRADQARRHTLATAPALIDQITGQYQRALGRESGADWAQPTGAHDAYSEGAIVTHDGKTWRSTIPSNVWAPGTYGWEQADDAETTPQPDAPAWAPGQQVAAGDLREYQGTVYEAIQGHTTQDGWTPPAVPSLWRTA